MQEKLDEMMLHGDFNFYAFDNHGETVFVVKLELMNPNLGSMKLEHREKGKNIPLNKLIDELYKKFSYLKTIKF